MRKILLLLISLLWLGFWWWWYTCKICTTCMCHKIEANTPTPKLQESGILLFNINDSNALVQPGWTSYRDSLLSNLSANQNIEIEGHYLSEEPNTTGFENMGMARADAIKKLFPDSIQKKIRLTSLQINRRLSMDSPFVASAIEVKTQSEKIVQSGDKTLVYFKYNSDQRIQDQEIEKYLNTLASQHKGLLSTFNIVGHTDNVGDDDSNMKLGQQRADAIKKYLLAQGIEADRLHATSLGEKSPIADNSSPEGRQKNRRTEIEIIQKQ